MTRTILPALSTAALALLVTVPAQAVGDPATRMTAAQAARYWATIRPLLVADGMACPARQHPATGVTTGGASPQGGSQQTTLTFNRGARVNVSRSWDRMGPATVQIRCTPS